MTWKASPCQPAFQAFKESLEGFTPEWAEAYSSVPADKIREIANNLVKYASFGSTVGNRRPNAAAAPRRRHHRPRHHQPGGRHALRHLQPRAQHAPGQRGQPGRHHLEHVLRLSAQRAGRHHRAVLRGQDVHEVQLAAAGPRLRRRVPAPPLHEHPHDAHHVRPREVRLRLQAVGRGVVRLEPHHGHGRPRGCRAGHEERRLRYLPGLLPYGRDGHAVRPAAARARIARNAYLPPVPWQRGLGDEHRPGVRGLQPRRGGTQGHEAHVQHN